MYSVLAWVALRAIPTICTRGSWFSWGSEGLYETISREATSKVRTRVFYIIAGAACAEVTAFITFLVPVPVCFPHPQLRVALARSTTKTSFSSCTSCTSHTTFSAFSSTPASSCSSSTASQAPNAGDSGIQVKLWRNLKLPAACFSSISSISSIPSLCPGSCVCPIPPMPPSYPLSPSPPSLPSISEGSHGLFDS